jgi:hypothetical protein
MNIGKEIVKLKDMTVTELRRRYAEVFGEETPSRHKEYLVKRIAWRLQSQAEGGLSERARARAAELARELDIRMTAPKMPATAIPGQTQAAAFPVSPDRRVPMPGAIITRAYKGRTVAVTVLPRGFEYEGEVFRSLSAVAKAVTGMHWNGYHFFHLAREASAHA